MMFGICFVFAVLGIIVKFFTGEIAVIPCFDLQARVSYSNLVPVLVQTVTFDGSL